MMDCRGFRKGSRKGGGEPAVVIRKEVGNCTKPEQMEGGGVVLIWTLTADHRGHTSEPRIRKRKEQEDRTLWGLNGKYCQYAFIAPSF